MIALIKKQLFDGKFEIQGEIAKGQTGTVLYGYDIGLRQEVAIKIYHSQINGRLIRGTVFVEKSKPLLLLEHPNLIKIFKVEEEADTPVVFMEFFDAPSLQQLIHDKGKLSVQDMLMLAREIAEVLVHTHFQGIIHGTLHPGHVLVGSQGQIKVMDLGLSWILMDILSDCDEDILRPLPYFPPELAKGELLNVSSDLYSLGFMMYEMITGTVPYAELPKTSIIGKLAFDQADPTFDFPSAVPEAICNLIREMTRNKAQQRLQDATYVLTIINQQLSKLPLSKTSKFLPAEPRQTQTRIPEEPTESTKAAPATSAIPEPSLKRAHQVQRPQSSVNYSEGNSTKMLSKIGIVLALIIVVGIAGTLGYWYRDFLEPHFSILQTPPEAPSLNTTLPQTRPVDNETPSSLAQDSLKKEAESAKNQLSNSDSQALGTASKTLSDSTSNATPLSPKRKMQQAQPTLTQTPKAGNTKQGQSLVPIQKQPFSKVSSTPVKSESSNIAPTGRNAASPSRINILKNAPAEKPPVLQPQNTKAQQKTSLVPILKQQIAKPQIAPRKHEPSTVTPKVPEVISPPITKAIKKTPLQKLAIQQPKAPKAQQGRSLVHNQKEPLSKQPPTLAKKKPSTITPDNPGNAPTPSIKALKNESLQSSQIQNPTKLAVSQKKVSTSPTLASTDITLEPTDEEIEEILQSLDAAKEDLSSITVP